VLRDVIILTAAMVISVKLKKILPSNLLGKITFTILGFVFLLIIAGLNKQNAFFIVMYYSSILLIYASLLAYIIRAIEFLRKNRLNEPV
jgi:hypothetical protein